MSNATNAEKAEYCCFCQQPIPAKTLYLNCADDRCDYKLCFVRASDQASQHVQKKHVSSTGPSSVILPLKGRSDSYHLGSSGSDSGLESMFERWSGKVTKHVDDNMSAMRNNISNLERSIKEQSAQIYSHLHSHDAKLDAFETKLSQVDMLQERIQKLESLHASNPGSFARGSAVCEAWLGGVRCLAKHALEERAQQVVGKPDGFVELFTSGVACKG